MLHFVLKFLSFLILGTLLPDPLFREAKNLRPLYSAPMLKTLKNGKPFGHFWNNKYLPECLIGFYFAGYHQKIKHEQIQL
jgi:hypothetical protein